jgi:hypothetical protein
MDKKFKFPEQLIIPYGADRELVEYIRDELDKAGVKYRTVYGDGYPTGEIRFHTTTGISLSLPHFLPILTDKSTNK